jgi:hypothetical protein
LRHIQVRVEDSEFEEFKARAERAGLSLQQAGHQALFAMSWDEKSETRIPVKLRPYLRRLAEILASGNIVVITAVTKNIDVFLAHLRVLRSLGAKR